jgi:hypothetical protein
MVIDESVIIVSVILSRDNAIQGKEESIIEELSKARKDSSGFHLEIKTQDTTCDKMLVQKESLLDLNPTQIMVQNYVRSLRIFIRVHKYQTGL